MPTRVRRPRQLPRQSVRQQQQQSAAADRSISGRNPAPIRTVCVRTCDGAYFPISFATVPARFPDDERTCKALCPAAEASSVHLSQSRRGHQPGGLDQRPALFVAAERVQIPQRVQSVLRLQGRRPDLVRCAEDRSTTRPRPSSRATSSSPKRARRRCSSARSSQASSGRAKKGRRRRSALHRAGRTAAPASPAAPAASQCTAPAPRIGQQADPHRCGPTFIPPQAARSLAARTLPPTRGCRARDQLLVRLRQRLADIAKAVGDGIAAVAAEILRA